ncbi:hypothetical protein ACWGTI_26110 [Mesorhizobium sp. ArgA1]
MTRDEARTAIIRQVRGLPSPPSNETFDPMMAALEESGSDEDYVSNVRTILAALQFVEWVQTGIHPKTNAVQ